MYALVDDADALVEASRAAIEVALADCTVRGATLPGDFRWPADPSSRPKLAHS